MQTGQISTKKPIVYKKDRTSYSKLAWVKPIKYDRRSVQTWIKWMKENEFNPHNKEIYYLKNKQLHISEISLKTQT